MVNRTHETLHAMNKAFTFDLTDYVVFVALLGVSSGIGVYFGFFSKGDNTTDEYLHGGKRMKTLPIAISLVASQLSGIAIMTTPAEIYGYGINFVFTVLSIFLVVPFLCMVVIPVFYENNVSNCYEYLQRRYNKTTRKIVTVMFILTTLLCLPVFMFVPSLAFSQVTGINIHVINSVVCSVGIFYTMLGGIRAVVWTDVAQALVMIGSSLLVAIMGVIGTGGMSEVIRKAYEGGRLDVNFELDLETRATIWNAFAGGFCMWGSYVGFNQSCVQRIVALPSLSHARKSLYIFLIGFLIITLVNIFIGVIMFAKYQECDPVALKVVEKPDKMVPYFVQDVAGHLFGIPGVFVSCVFSASLSTISAGINSLSGIIYFDYVKPYVNHSEWKANLFMKICVVVIGVYCVLAGIVVEQFNSILQVIYTISGISHGTVFGIFSVGLLVPRVHGKAGLLALMSSLIAMLVICTGAQMKINSGKLSYEPLPLRTDGCEELNNSLPSIKPRSPIISTIENDENEEFSIFDISYYWYAVVGTVFVWLTAILLSFIIPSDQKLDSKLVSPIVRSFVEENTVEAEAVPLKAH